MRGTNANAYISVDVSPSADLSSFQVVDWSGISIALTWGHQPSSCEAIGAESSSENTAASLDYQYSCIGVLTAIASNTAT